MIKIGLIAPEWSLDRILSVAGEFANEIKLIPFRFNTIDDIPEILDKHRETIQKWLLSGPLPYHVAKSHLKNDDDLIHCRVTEAGVLKVLLEVAYHHGSFLENISIDFMEEVVNIEEILNGINIPRKKVYISRYQNPLDEEALFRFHLDLWKKKATCCAITTVPYVYAALKKAGIPVYNMQVSRMEIRLTIELLIEKKRSLYFKNTQLGLMIVEISKYEDLAERAKTPYKLQLQELEINNALLTYCQQIDGYLVPKGNGRYEIFGSRGNIENSIQALNGKMEEITLNLNTPLIAGIGFGETVFLAQINSNKALRHAREKSGIIIYGSDGDIVEYSAGSRQLSYSLFSEDEDLNNRLQKAKVGIRTYKKIVALTQRFGEKSFSASTLATQMGVTDRNLRRIISGLLDAGLLVCVGEEASGVRGRPAKLYRLAE